MARKKKSSNSGAATLAVIATALVLFAVLAPIIVFLAWLYYEFRCRTFQPVDSLDAFAPSASEAQAYDDARASLEEYQAYYDEIEQLGNNLPRRQDGAYDARNSAGRELNDMLQTLIPKMSEAEQKVRSIQALPLNRLREWSYYMGARFAFRVAILLYAVVGLTVFSLSPEWAIGFSSSISTFTLIPLFPNGSILYAVTIVAATVSALAVAPTWWFKRYLLEHLLEHEAAPIGSGIARHIGRAVGSASSAWR
jgi:hypothetical protein